jgi:uncharacterized protein (TIGR00730 family)
VAAIGVFCASSQVLDQRWLDLARDVGVELGRRGHHLVSGGGCVGMMGAIAVGARSAGTHTVGVMSRSLAYQEVADTDADELVMAADLSSRKNIIVDKSDGFLVLPGGLGTLDEFFEVWTTASLSLHAKPVALLDADGFYSGLLDWLRTLVTSRFVRSEALELLIVEPTVDDALDALEREIG